MFFKKLADEKCQILFKPESILQGLASMGVDLEGVEETDPAFMTQLFTEINLNIKDLEHNESKDTTSSLDFLRQLLQKPIPLTSLKKQILQGIINNPPLAQTILEASKLFTKTTRPLSENPKQSLQIKYAVHFIVLLETLTQLMLKDKNFFALMMDAMLKQRRVKQPGAAVYNFWQTFFNTGDLFTALKMISIDPSMWGTRCWQDYQSPTQDQVEEFIKKHHLQGLNAQLLRQRLTSMHSPKNNGRRVNIIEAIISEEGVDSKDTTLDNRHAGFALVIFLEMFEKNFHPTWSLQHSSGKPTIDSKDSSSKIKLHWEAINNHATKDTFISQVHGLPKTWVNLYESWNIAFVLRKFSDLPHLLLPKLLIPATLLTKPENFMAARIISLWLTVGFINNMMANKVKISFPPASSEREILLSILGKNNLQYAKHHLFKCEINFNDLYNQYLRKDYSLILLGKIMAGIYIIPEHLLEKLRKEFTDDKLVLPAYAKPEAP